MKAVLLTGIPGLGKTELAKKFRRYLLKDLDVQDVRGLHGERFEEEAEEHIPILELFNTQPYDRETPLDDFYAGIRDMAGVYKEQLRKRVKVWKKSKKFKFIIFHTHISYWLSGHFRSWLGMVDMIKLLKDKGIEIRRVINLLDNVFVHYKRLSDVLGLKEIYLWRDVEMMVSEHLAAQLYSPAKMRTNFKVLAVGQSLRTLARLLDEKPTRQIYLAYPISAVRRMNAAEQGVALEENKRFRAAMEDQVIAYDPGAIDELPLLHKYKKNVEQGTAGDATSIRASELWPTFLSDEQKISVSAAQEWQIPNSEIESILGRGNSLEGRIDDSLTTKHIRSRDLTLVIQAEGVIAYRPTLGNKWSGSVRVEIQRVKERLRYPFYLICDNADRDVNDGSAALEFNFLTENVGKFDLSSEAGQRVAFESALKYIQEKYSGGDRWGAVR